MANSAQLSKNNQNAKVWTNWSDPATPRLRPFTILLDKEFDYSKVKDTSLSIIAESIDYLKNTNKLCQNELI